MGKATDNLIALADSVSSRAARPRDGHAADHRRAGVRRAADDGARRRSASTPISFTGSQVGIITDNVHRKAKIVEVKGDRVREALAAGKVAVVAGFQGVSLDKEITTMGRGGQRPHRRRRSPRRSTPTPARSTPTSPACSAPTRASCPRPASCARVNFDEMLEMAGAGSKVLALRSVEFARNHNVPLHVRSAFTWEPGTWVTDRGARAWKIRSSPASSPTSARPRSPCSACPTGRASRRRCSSRSPRPTSNVDMIVQNTSTDGTTDISFTMPKADMADAEQIVAEVAARDRGAGRDPRRRHRQGRRSSAPA